MLDTDRLIDVHLHRYVKHMKKKRRGIGPDFVSVGGLADVPVIERHEGFDNITYVRDTLTKLDSVYYPRSRAQKKCHETYLATCTPLIVGRDEFEKNKAKYMEFLGVKTYHSKSYFRAPRRFGKSIAIGSYTAALLLACPNIKIGIIAQGKRAAESLAGMTQSALFSLEGVGGYIVRPLNRSRIQLKFSNTDIRELIAYPSTVDVSVFARVLTLAGQACVLVQVDPIKNLY